MNFSKVYNPIVKALLRSPFHGMISGGTMLVTFCGLKSGKMHSTPVNYFREDDNITVFSRRNRVWWRNLRGNGEVTVRIKGRDVKAFGQAVEDEEKVTAGLQDYLQKRPKYAKYFHVALEAPSQPNRDDVAQAAKDRVLIRIRLAPGSEQARND